MSEVVVLGPVPAMLVQNEPRRPVLDTGLGFSPLALRNEAKPRIACGATGFWGRGSAPFRAFAPLRESRFTG